MMINSDYHFIITKLFLRSEWNLAASYFYKILNFPRLNKGNQAKMEEWMHKNEKKNEKMKSEEWM